MIFDRMCTGNGMRHLLTAPYSPTTTGKAERQHKTMPAEFFTPNTGMFTTIPELQPKRSQNRTPESRRPWSVSGPGPLTCYFMG